MQYTSKSIVIEYLELMIDKADLGYSAEQVHFVLS